MKDFTKLLVAGGFLSILFLYSGLDDHGSKANQADGPLTISSVQQDSPAAQPIASHVTLDRNAATPTVSTAVADASAKRPEQRSDSKKRRTTMRFVVYFDFDSARVSSRSKRTIRQALAFARSVEAKNVGLAGFADRAGPADYNMKLSERRANVVAAALKNLDTGLQALSVNAFGEERLAVNTPDGLAEQRNRRVEIIISV